MTRRRDRSVPVTGCARPVVHLGRSTREATDQGLSRSHDAADNVTKQKSQREEETSSEQTCAGTLGDPPCLKSKHFGPASGRSGRLTLGWIETDAMVSLLSDKEF